MSESGALQTLSARFTSTRRALHQIAFFAVAPVRYEAEGRMGLRPAPGGFGTPEFEGRVVRVEGNLLVYEENETIATRTITTVREAAEFFGREYQVEWFPDFHDAPQPFDPDSPLDIDLEAARALARWFDFGFEILERLRSHATAEDMASNPQLWPEHFDAAIEMGEDKRGQRASYGASPGDEHHPEPYLYVSAWGEIDRSNRYWNDRAFNGSSLPYGDLREAPTERGLEFLLAGHRLLRGDG